jgi:hypothetical protein
MYVDLTKHAVGLGGGTIISGSVNASFTTAFWYYPITATVVNKITFSDLVGGDITSASFTAGVGISGTITSVSQSSGIAVVYNALPDFVPNPPGYTIVPPSGRNS